MKFHPTLTADFMTTSGLLDTMAIILGFSDSIARLNFYLQLHRRSCEREDRYVFRDEEWPGLEADGGRRRAHPGVELKSGKYRGQGEWSRVVRGAPRGTPGKVEGVNAGKGPFRAREVPVPTSKSRQTPGKVEGGSAGKGPSPARGVPVPKPRRVPGKVEGVSAGKGPSRTREVPVPKPRQTPGKVEGGSAGKGPSPARGMPVPKPRRVPGKVEGVSAGKGPFRAREVPVPKPRQTPGKVEGASAGKGPSPARGVPVPKPRRVPGKVEGVSAGKGPSRAREVPVPKPRQTPGKIEGGSAGKGPSPARSMPVPKPRRVPGKVEGVSAGKGPSRAREVPVPKPRQTPGKIEGGSAGKGPSPARSMPVPKPRRVPGKVEGVSAGKGPFRTRGVLMSKREWKRTSGRRMCQFKVAQDKGEVVEGIDCHKENVHYVICPTGWSSCKLRKGRESTAVSGGFSRGQTRCRRVNGKTGKRRDKYPVATKLEVRMLYSGPIHPSGWVEQVKQVGTCKSSEERVGDDCDAVTCKSSEKRVEDECGVVTCKSSEKRVEDECGVVTCKSSEERVGDKCDVPGKSGEERVEDKCDVTGKSSEERVGDECNVVPGKSSEERVGDECNVPGKSSEERVGDECNVPGKSSEERVGDECDVTGPRVVLLHAAEDEEFVRGLVEWLGRLGCYYLPQTAIFCQQVTGTPGDVSRAQLTSTLTLGSVKLVVPVISRHLLADQSSLTVGLETAVRNNKPRYVIWLDQNQDDFREFGTLVSRQYPTLEAPARRVQRDRVEETMPGSGVGGMFGIARDVRDALCRQTGELRFPCWRALLDTRAFLADNMNLPAVLTRLEQENQLSPAEVRDIQAEPTPVSRVERLVDMLQDRRRQEPYDWLGRVLREEGQDFLVEEMEERERGGERLRGIREQQAAQPGQQTAQKEHFAQQSQVVSMQKYLRHRYPGAHADDATTLTVKGVILGLTEAGKTSLLNCMVKGQGHIEIETDRTIGVDVITYHDTKNSVKYEMYDFGGHQIYHYTHRFFLTRQALHILNVDLPGYKSEKFQERVGTWLTSVTSHVFNPTILVVGTKADLFPTDKAEEMIAAACSSIQREIQVAESKIQTKLNEEIQLCQNAVEAADVGDLPDAFYGLTKNDILTKKESLEKLLDGRPKGMLKIQVIPVSSKTFQGIEALCSKMAEMVKDERRFPAARQELPTSWTKLSENIKTSGRTHLHVRDCQDVGTAAGMKESDVLNALSYLHVTGQILFYNHIRGMEDLVFPDPTIILTLFKQIFRHDLPAYLDSIAESLSGHTRVEFAENRATFLKTGRASDSFIKNLLGDNTATFNSLLPLMKHFGLCYSGSVIFPTELPDVQPDEVVHCWPDVVPSGGEEIFVTIEYSQEPPLGLPETMVSRILSMEQTTRRLLTKDTVIVHVGENSEDVMYRHFPTREEIRIRGEPEKAWRQAQTVAKVIEACWDEFPALYSSNSVGSGETTKPLTMEAVRRHVPGDLLRMSEGNWERAVEFLVTRTPEDDIGKYFIDNRLYQVSRAVGEEWQLWARLGHELGLNRAVLDNTAEGSYAQKAFQMLKAWRTKTPHGPLHYLPQLQETLQNIRKPDLAAAVQGVYKEYREALPIQEVSPEVTGDTEWSLRLPGEGKYLCRRTDLGVVTPYPLHVTYRSANWSDNWQQVGEWMPVGPLFSIQCEDVEGPVDILLPHVLHLADATELTPEDIQVVHVVGNSPELLPVTELTPSHAVTRFKKGSLFGVVGRTEKTLSVSRNGLLMVFASMKDYEISKLKVYIVSNTRIMKETLKKDERDWKFEPRDSRTCDLCPGALYHLEGSVSNGRDMFVSSSPKCLMFEDTFDTNKFYEPFRVEVTADIWNNSTTSRLKLELLKEAKDGAKEPIAELTLGHYKRGYTADGDDSGLSTPTELAAMEAVRRQLESSNISGKSSVLLVGDEFCTSKGGISTINLNVARKLTAAGAEVYATVLEASEQDERDAERDGVKLIKPRFDADGSVKPSLEWLTVYHSVHFPHIPPDICCIVGHVDVTSRAARKIKEERFPHAKLAMFGHVAPEETEHYKSDEKALGVGRKEASIQEDIGKADVVFSVGARIHRHYDRFLRRNRVDHNIFLPEPSKVFREANVSFAEESKKVRKPERSVLSVGRVRDVEMLKGHDLAAGAIDKVAQRLGGQYTLRLRVRGIDENDFKESKRILEEKLKSGRVKPTLLPYGTQEDIRRDMENCHLVLMPSRAEPFGLVGLEAIAAGVPVLISEHSGLAELIEELSDRLGQPKFRHCIVKMKGDTATDGDAEKWAERIEDVLKNARSEFAEARAFREKLLASKYWEESHQKFLQACGITADPNAQAEGGGADVSD
ncbi:MFHAS1 [Branchiostoma lanceolatum]|uniref:MFHAS1 protein n=1 Tax=Branchiostoma lanceolatum TaxID=7740 RepID=A0A8J9Z4I0_BRALA|nr:MFHAS1 [Branchiostoma lanceolatum]